MRGRSSRCRQVEPDYPETIGEAWERCQFRTLVSLVPGGHDELLGRVGAAFAALHGEADAIRPDMLASLVETVCSGQTVVVLADREALRDAAKAELMSAVNAALIGAAGSA